MLLLSSPAYAEIQNDYMETFDSVNPAGTGFHPKGWGRHYYSSYYAATYSLEEISEGNNAVKVVQKFPNAIAYDDYLVTPAVSGRVTLRLKLADTGGSMKFYAVTATGTDQFSKGDELIPDINPELTTDGFQEVGFTNIEEGTRIGLRGHNIIFDDFSAENADVVYKRSLNLSSISLESSAPEFIRSGSNYSIELAEGNALSLTFAIQLTNDGEVPFNLNEEGYTLTLSVSGTDYSTQPINQQLEPGERVSETHTFNLDGGLFNGAVTFNIRENICESSDWQKITIVPYHAEFKLQSSESSSSYNNISNGSTLNFGSSQIAQSETVWIYNTGTAPLTFAMEVDSDGFTASAGDVLSVAAGDHIPCVISTVANGEYGPRTALLKFTGDEFGEFHLNLKANMLDPARWFENFSAQKLPDNMIDEGNIWNFSTGKATVAANSSGSKLITPKLTVEENESLTVSLAKNGSSSYVRPTFKAFRSVDRVNWEEINGDFPASDLGADFEEFTISGIAPGDCYLGFECSNVRIAEFYGFTKAPVDHDVVVTSESLPPQGEVNSAYTASITVRNVGPALGEGTFNAILTADGITVATSPAEILASGATATYTLSFTPHSPATPSIIQLKLVSSDGNTAIASSSPVEVSISEEVMRSDAQIGTMGTSSNNRTPVMANYKFTYSDIIYFADKIPLESGAKINRIAFKGKTSVTGVKSHIRVWIENTDATSIPNSQNTWAELDDSNAAKDFEWEFPVVNGEEILVIDLSEAPFVYDGRNIRMRFINQAVSTGAVNYFNDSKAGKAAYDYDNSATYSPKTYTADPPVAFLSIEANPIVVTGTVTDASTGNPVTSAAVTVKSGEVEYYSTSDAEGVYTAILKKDIDGYTVNVTAPGYFPYSAPIGEVTDNAVTHNAALNPACDLYLKSQSIPTEGTVNTEMTLTALVQNVNSTPFEAGRYNVNLIVDGEVENSLSGVALAPNYDTADNPDSEHLYTFAYTCHTPGTHEIAFAITWDEDNRLNGTPVEVTVAQEIAEGTTTVGSPDGFSTQAPVSLFYGYSTSTTLYPASKIAVPAGAEITEISYNGYYTSGSPSTAAIEVWIQNTDDTVETDPVFDTASMTKVAERTLTFDRKGSSYEAVEMMSFTLDTPFIYSGSNLRVVIRTQSNGYNANFETDESGTTYYKQNNSSWESLDAQSPSATGMSVINLTFNNARRFKGQIADEADAVPIADASVTLTSGNVKYFGTTDEVGQFEIPVIRHDRDYSLDISAEGYQPLHIESIDLSEEKTHMLRSDGTSSVGQPVITRPDTTDAVFNIRGVRVSDSYRGIKIRKGNKTINKH